MDLIRVSEGPFTEVWYPAALTLTPLSKVQGSKFLV